MRSLLIRPGAIGDTLLTFPVIRAMKVKCPEEQITLVGNSAVLPLALEWGVVDAVEDYEDPLWGQLFRSSVSSEPAARGHRTIAKQLALHNLLQHYERVICWLRDSDGTVERNLRLANVKDVVIAPGRPPTEIPARHIVDYLADTIGLDTFRPRTLWSNPISAHMKIHDRSLQHQRYTVAIHPGSGGTYKCWSSARFVQVITRLWRSNIAVLLLAGPADHERLAALQSQLPTPPQAALLYELVDAPLLTVAQQLADCACYLGNDAGITHLAALLGLPTVVLFGASDPLIWQPVGPSVTIVQAESLEAIPVENVLSKLETCIAHSWEI